MSLFVADHLHKRFGDQVVLEDISFSFPAGSVSGIIGPNGAGKSTCFNVLTGMYKPDRGRVIFDGEDMQAHGGLFPLDHSVRVIAKDEDGEVHFEPHRGLEFLGVQMVKELVSSS